MSGPAPLFLYGTLRNPEHLAVVLGRGDARTTPARLAGHAVRWDADERFPVIQPEAGAKAAGLLLEVTVADLGRLDFYEASFGYERRAVTAATGAGPRQAECYFPPAGARADGPAWSLEDWDARWSAAAIRAAAEAMSLYGQLSPEDFVRRYPMMLGRGWARAMAAAGAAPAAVRSGAGRAAVDCLGRTRRHTGFFALDELRLSHPAFAGGRLEVVREVFVSSDAALVLPYDPKRDLVALVEQFRAGAYLREDPMPWTLEPVAGLVDPGESPEDCARREAGEEAGLHLSRLVRVMAGYPSPGATTEYYHLFVGLCDLDPAAHGGRNGGVDAEGEDIRTHVLPLDAALALVGTGEVNVVPLATLLFWTAAHRAELSGLA